jgi:hypothetical protein
LRPDKGQKKEENRRKEEIGNTPMMRKEMIERGGQGKEKQANRAKY